MNFLSIQEAAGALRQTLPRCKVRNLPARAIVLLMEPSPHLCPLGEKPTTPCDAPSSAPAGEEWVWLTDAWDSQEQHPAEEEVAYMMPCTDTTELVAVLRKSGWNPMEREISQLREENARLQNDLRMAERELKEV